MHREGPWRLVHSVSSTEVSSAGVSSTVISPAEISPAEISPAEISSTEVSSCIPEEQPRVVGAYPRIVAALTPRLTGTPRRTDTFHPRFATLERQKRDYRSHNGHEDDHYNQHSQRVSVCYEYYDQQDSSERHGDRERPEQVSHD
jgi:hypothetical protein